MMDCGSFEYVTNAEAIKAVTGDKYKGDRKQAFMDYLNSTGDLRYKVTKVTVH